MMLSFKFTFSLIAFTALLVSGSGLMIQDAYGVFDAPEFTCNHINTTATHCTFDMKVNGTLAIADWGIRYLTTATDGDITYDAAISNIANSTSVGIGETAPSVGDKRISSKGGNGASHPVVGLGFLNGTDFVLIHAAIPSDATYYINYTNNPSSTNNQTLAAGQGSGAFHTSGLTADCGAAHCGEGTITNKFLKIGSNATAKDWMVPSAVSAEKTGPKKIAVLMSETVGNINSTGVDFTLSGLHDSVVSSLIASNGTNTIYLTTRNLIDPINDTPTITLSYNSDADGDGHGIDKWITDAIDSTRYTNSGVLDTAEWAASGHGNRLLNFTSLVVTYPTDFNPDAQHYPPHIHDEVSISINSDELYDLKIHDNITSNILAYVGDTISVTVSIGDDYYLSGISRATLITNYDHEPSGMNQYYSPNHDELGQTGLSVYEWNQNTFDQKYDYAGVVSWDESIIKIDKRIETYHEFVGPLLFDENELFITYSMTFDDVMPKSQVGIKIIDTNNNYFESFLPFTLEVLPNDTVVITEPSEDPAEEPAEESTSFESELVEITLVINSSSYENGDKVIVTGQIQNYDLDSMMGQDILYDIISPENVVLSSGQIGPNSDGTFYFTTFAMDTMWKTDGNYIFSVDMRSIKQTIDISYDNTNFETPIPESEIPLATIITEAIPEATPEATPEAIPEATPAATPAATPEATPEATPAAYNSNIICGTGTEDVNGICQVIQTEEKSFKGGGCLIATAAYGSEMAPQVQLLREIRDNQLLQTDSGTAFMTMFNDVYYSFSPIIADYERENPLFKEAVNLAITPMITSLSLMENAETESEVLSIGLSVIALNLGMYLGAPAIVIIGIKKRSTIY